MITVSAIIGEEAFEWDSAKRIANLQKHGVDFVRAAEIFSCLPTLEKPAAPKGKEKRWLAIGLQNKVTLVVIYTPRGEVRRLISARPANRGERRQLAAIKKARKKSSATPPVKSKK